MDSLSSHKGPKIAQLIAGAVPFASRYQSPYSPGMNPIERAFSKLKAILRKIAERTDFRVLAAARGPGTAV